MGKPGTGLNRVSEKEVGNLGEGSLAQIVGKEDCKDELIPFGKKKNGKRRNKARGRREDRARLRKSHKKKKGRDKGNANGNRKGVQRKGED